MSTVANLAESGAVHRRAMPEAWPQLVAPIEQAPHSIEVAKEVWERVGEFGPDELDENRYYAMGSALCYYARAMKPVLGDPVKRQELVDNGAAGIVHKHPNLKPCDIIEEILKPKMEAALAHRSAADRILGDILEVHALISRGDGPLLTRDEFFDDYILKAIRNDESYLADNLKTNVIGAVGVIDDIVSEAQRDRGYRNSPANGLPASQDIAMLRSPHTLLWLKKLAARVPLEQAEFLFSPVFDEDVMGTQSLRDIDWEVEQAEMDKRAEEWLRKGYPIRTAKLVCPAMHVTGMIDDSVALAIDMLDEARAMQAK